MKRRTKLRPRRRKPIVERVTLSEVVARLFVMSIFTYALYAVTADTWTKSIDSTSIIVVALFTLLWLYLLIQWRHQVIVVDRYIRQEIKRYRRKHGITS